MSNDGTIDGNNAVHEYHVENSMDLEIQAEFGASLELKELDLCIPECLLGRANMDVPMIPCGLCEGWFHIRCLGLPEGGGPRCIRGLYFCQDCLKDLRELRLLAKPRREREARFEAMESLVTALDVEQALLKELLSRTDMSLDDVVVRVGGRVVDATYAALLRERAGLKRELVDAIATSEASMKNSKVEKQVEPNARFNLLSRLQDQVQSRVENIRPIDPPVQIEEEASVTKVKAEKVIDQQNIPSISGTSTSSSVEQESDLNNGKPFIQIQDWSNDKVDNKCQICAWPFKRFDNLKVHLLHIHQLELFLSCAICDQKFHLFRPLRDHQIRTHGSLAEHVKVLVPTTSFVSPPVVPRSRRRRGRHLTRGKKNASLTSPLASRALAGLATKNSLAKETGSRKQIFRGEDGKYACPICIFRYKKLANLKSHLVKWHREQVEFICLGCDEHFSHYWNLLSHQSSHPTCQAAGKTVTHRPVVDPQAGGSLPSVQPQEGPSEEIALEGGIIASYSSSSAQPQFQTVAKIPAKIRSTTKAPVSSSQSGGKQNRCHLCVDSFHSSKSLRDHLLRRHQVEVLFSCNFCKVQFSMCTELRRHQLEFHGGSNGYRKLFRRSSAHAQATGYKPMECHICGDHFKDTWLLKTHLLRLHQMEMMYSCNSCGRRYSKIGDLRRHQHSSKHKSHTKVFESTTSQIPGEVDVVAVVTKTTPIPIKCETSPTSSRLFEPGLSSGGGAVVPRHGQAVDPSSGKHACHLCGSAVTRLENLKLHLLRRHMTKMLYSCDTCGEHAPNIFKMRRHQVTQHGAKGSHHRLFAPATNSELELGLKPRLCQLCHMRFDSTNSLKCHMRRRHQIEYVETCATCGQQFDSRHTLNAHLKATICGLCDVPTDPSGGRDSPEVVAVRLAPVSRRMASAQPRRKIGKSFAASRVRCTLCRKLFSSKGSLLGHLKVAHPEQYETKICPFSCRFCGRKFEHAKSMYSHVSRNHQQDNEGSRSPSHLNATHPNQHDVTSLNCPYCDRRFEYRNSLHRHITRHHPEFKKYTSHPMVAQPDQDDVMSIACPYCDRKFKRRNTLHQHISRQHPEFKRNGRGGDQGASPRNAAGGQHSQMAFQVQNQDHSSNWNEISEGEIDQLGEMEFAESEPALMTYDDTEGQGEWMEPTCNESSSDTKAVLQPADDAEGQGEWMEQTCSESSSHTKAVLQVPEEQGVCVKLEHEPWAPIYLVDTEMDQSGV